ncbi:MAG: adenylate/guanylate cyclase domain-containing protein [Alphaproteobacteria bacterium]|nr:adenylate/guanylate cyclase domain-containing protein [Alphaproteobacteria bacterium]
MQAEAPIRKPLALVICDIAGSTRLIAREGDLVATSVFREFFEYAGRLGRKHHSLMIKFMGDSFLAAFENIDDVMPFIISIERLLSQNSIFVGRLLGFYFSLHYGNVLYIETSYGSEVLGDAVNVAAYLNELKAPNEVVISRDAFERLHSDYRARAGASESRSFKGVGDVEFRRLDLLGL